MTKAPKWFWVITEYDGLEGTFQNQFPGGYWSDHEMVSLLQRLASRYLTPNEIISASMRRNRKQRNGLLDVRRETGPGKYILSVGENPHWTARTVKE